jgi:membrane fusion protein, heavy metal efflux system
MSCSSLAGILCSSTDKLLAYLIFRNKMRNFIIHILLFLLLFSCNSEGENSKQNGVALPKVEEEHNEAHEKLSDEIHLSKEQLESLELKSGPLLKRVLSGEVFANGKLELPPQNKAVITSLVEGRVTDVKVIEGEKVSKGQTLALLQDPEIIQMQTELMETSSRLEFLRKEYERKKRLYEEKVGSGKEYQRVSSEYASALASFRGLKSKLSMLGINTSAVLRGHVYDHIRLTSPLDGYIKKVNTSLGNHVSTDEELFEIVNTDHIHADLMVFEKDMNKIREGQQVYFNVATKPGEEIQGEIYAVGKTFEEGPKAMHVHADIDNKEGLLMPGMYITGRIVVKGDTVLALPEEAIVREGERQLVFMEHPQNDKMKTFKPVTVETGLSSSGFVAVYPMESLPDSAKFVYNAAYYLLAEMQKGEAGHHH